MKEKVEEFLNNNLKGESVNDILSRVIATLRMSEQWNNFNANPGYQPLYEKHCKNREPLKNLATILSRLEEISPKAGKILSHSFRTSPRN